MVYGSHVLDYSFYVPDYGSHVLDYGSPRRIATGVLVFMSQIMAPMSPIIAPKA